EPSVQTQTGYGQAQGNLQDNWFPAGTWDPVTGNKSKSEPAGSKADVSIWDNEWW
ncbi:hypothetical protein CDV31_000745, partial [Fusarium ambrosium]